MLPASSSQHRGASFSETRRLQTPPSPAVYARPAARSVMQVKTVQEGYNSGRAYYIRGESSACQDAIGSLVALSRAARVRAEKRTRFERNQLQASRRARATAGETGSNRAAGRGSILRSIHRTRKWSGGEGGGVRREGAERRPAHAISWLPWAKPDASARQL